MRRHARYMKVSAADTAARNQATEDWRLSVLTAQRPYVIVQGSKAIAAGFATREQAEAALQWSDCEVIDYEEWKRRVQMS